MQELLCMSIFSVLKMTFPGGCSKNVSNWIIKNTKLDLSIQLSRIGSKICEE